MGYNDPEKQSEYHREWREKNKERNSDRHREWREKHMEYQRAKSREYYREKHPNCKHRYGAYHDFETHHQLAINSGIETALEWRECVKLGLMPDGIYQNPADAFRQIGHRHVRHIHHRHVKRKDPLKNNNTP